ncbi:MAG: hypothetical protein LBQ10_04270 [Desulfovibrio sp.]|nr:hypothetical protein [Desulfovibrio sp.]
MVELAFFKCSPGGNTIPRLRVRGELPLWDVEALPRLPHCPVENPGAGEYPARLPGTAHLLLNADIQVPDDCMTVMQPGGSSLDVRSRRDGDGQRAAVGGPVSPVAGGSVWLSGGEA